MKTIPLLPGITLRCVTDLRFKHGFLSVQLVRVMCKEEAAMNALIPTVLLRGTATAPDMRAITRRLDDLYGASVGPIARRVGDYQATGLYCSFISDRFAMDTDRILEPAIAFLGQLLLEPVTENGYFRADYVSSEKKNLIAAIEAQRNDKRAYASAQMLNRMCREDSLGVPRMGETEQVRSITPETAWAHYQKILRESPVEIFYVGEAEPETVARILRPMFSQLTRSCGSLPAQTAYHPSEPGEHQEAMEVAQGKLAMGFYTPVTIRDPEFPAMQVCNVLFGGGMTSLLFMQVREKLSLCYDISSSYYGSKGVMTVGAGIDCHQYEAVRAEVLTQLEVCCRGEFTPEQLEAAKQTVMNSLRGTHDSPGAIESYYSSSALSGLAMTPAQYIAAVEAVTAQQVAEVAAKLKLHTVYFLKGVS